MPELTAPVMLNSLLFYASKTGSLGQTIEWSRARQAQTNSINTIW